MMKTLFEEANSALKLLVGREDAQLRDDQWEAIRALVEERRRVVVVERTGWGKSAVYFVATALLRARSSGPTVIISPLLSLMRNQVEAARRAGIKAETLNSSNLQDWDEIYQKVESGDVDVLLVSPERLNNPDFRARILPSLATSAGLLVIDEAHCISDWGHDFRPDYRRIKTLLGNLRSGVPVLATTATANTRVTDDIMNQLSTGSIKVLTLRGELTRESLFLAVKKISDPALQLAWLSETLKKTEGSGIIYALTVSSAEKITSFLISQGHKVRSYSGQSDPQEREICEQELLANKVKALVATSALGMGFDKPDLAFIIHVGAPSSPVAYYQQIGRAGRATDKAEVFLLPTPEEESIWKWYADVSFPDAQTVSEVLSHIGSDPVTTVSLESKVTLKRSRLELMLKVLDVEGALERISGGWVASGNDWFYDQDRYDHLAQVRSKEQDLMREYENLSSCRMAFLRSSLDDPALTESWLCGRCDNCTGAFDSVSISEEVSEAARLFLSDEKVVLSPRRQWAPGLKSMGVGLSGPIPISSRHQPGLALARLDSIGTSSILRDVFSGDDGPLPAALAPKVRDLLKTWDSKIDGIIVLNSASRPQLTSSLGRGASKILGVPIVGTVEPAADLPSRHETNSTHRLADVSRRLHLCLSSSVLERLPGKRILLIDDYVKTGWSAAYASKLITDAGASVVELFALAQA